MLGVGGVDSGRVSPALWAKPARGQNQTLGCSPHPTSHSVLPAPSSDGPCRAEGAEGSPAVRGEHLILLLMAPLW